MVAVSGILGGLTVFGDGLIVVGVPRFCGGTGVAAPGVAGAGVVAPDVGLATTIATTR